MENGLYLRMQSFLGDEKKLLDRMAGRIELWEECVRLFPREEMIEEMDAAAEKKDYDALYAAVHRLKGNLANFGFEKTAEKATEILAAIKEKELFLISDRYEKLRAEYLQIINKIDEA